MSDIFCPVGNISSLTCLFLSRRPSSMRRSTGPRRAGPAGTSSPGSAAPKLAQCGLRERRASPWRRGSPGRQDHSWRWGSPVLYTIPHIFTQGNVRHIVVILVKSWKLLRPGKKTFIFSEKLSEGNPLQISDGLRPTFHDICTYMARSKATSDRVSNGIHMVQVLMLHLRCYLMVYGVASMTTPTMLSDGI